MILAGETAGLAETSSQLRMPSTPPDASAERSSLCDSFTYISQNRASLLLTYLSLPQVHEAQGALCAGAAVFRQLPSTGIVIRILRTTKCKAQRTVCMFVTLIQTIKSRKLIPEGDIAVWSSETSHTKKKNLVPQVHTGT